jgi:hypothetical protein
VTGSSSTRSFLSPGYPASVSHECRKGMRMQLQNRSPVLFGQNASVHLAFLLQTGLRWFVSLWWRQDSTNFRCAGQYTGKVEDPKGSLTQRLFWLNKRMISSANERRTRHQLLCLFVLVVKLTSFYCTLTNLGFSSQTRFDVLEAIIYVVAIPRVSCVTISK